MRRYGADDGRLAPVTVAVVVRAMDGDEDKEIARALGKPVDTVKGILKGVFLRYRLRGRAELWRLLELSEVREEVARTSRLGLVLTWSFAYLAGVRRLVEVQTPQVRERRWTETVSRFAAEPCLIGELPATPLRPEAAALLRVRGLLQAAQARREDEWPVDAMAMAVEGLLQLIEALGPICRTSPAARPPPAYPSAWPDKSA